MPTAISGARPSSAIHWGAARRDRSLVVGWASKFASLEVRGLQRDRATGATGLEPATSGVTGRHSHQLSYAPLALAQYRRGRPARRRGAALHQGFVKPALRPATPPRKAVF